MFKALPTPMEKKLMIDLHGKSVQEAKKILAERFTIIESTQITEFYIITGKGNHINADGSRGVLRKILPKLLKPYSQHISEVNAEMGAYKIILKKHHERNPLTQILDRLFDEKEQAKYLEGLKEKAEKNDINALITLAIMHWSGNFKTASEPQKSIQKAIDLLERAKQLGAMEAYVLLAEFYLTKAEYKRAIHYLEYAAKQNYSMGQLGLAKCYLLGQGVKQNDDQAVYWMTKAADQGEAFAQSNLGRSYFNGEFTSQNIELSIKYLRLAAAQGVAESMSYLARCYATGDGIEKDVNKAFHLYFQAAQLNDIFALYQVGEYLLKGRIGLPPSSKEALPWYVKAAELGDSDSQAKLALLYLFSEERDIQKGLVWLQKALEQKNKLAGEIYSRLEQIDPKALDETLRSLKVQIKPDALNETLCSFEIYSSQSEPPIKTSKEILQELTRDLGLSVDWKITKNDQAWCYITSNEMLMLKEIMLEPFMLRKTVTKQDILLLEHCSNYDLTKVSEVIKVQFRVTNTSNPYYFMKYNARNDTSLGL